MSILFFYIGFTSLALFICLLIFNPRCPWRYRRKHETFSTIVSGDYVDHMVANDDRNEAEHDRKWPTCWAKFLHWLGLK